MIQPKQCVCSIVIMNYVTICCIVITNYVTLETGTVAPGRNGCRGLWGKGSAEEEGGGCEGRNMCRGL